MNCLRPPGSGFHGGVIRDDYRRAAFDAREAGDHSRGRRLTVILVVGHQQTDLQEHGALIDELPDSFTRREFSRGVLLFDFCGTAAGAQLVFKKLPFLDQRSHVIGGS